MVNHFDWDRESEDEDDIKIGVDLPQNSDRGDFAEPPGFHVEPTGSLAYVMEDPEQAAEHEEMSDGLAENEDRGCDIPGPHSTFPESNNQQHLVRDVSTSTLETIWKFPALCRLGWMLVMIILFIFFVATIFLMRRFYF